LERNVSSSFNYIVGYSKLNTNEAILENKILFPNQGEGEEKGGNSKLKYHIIIHFPGSPFIQYSYNIRLKYSKDQIENPSSSSSSPFILPTNFPTESMTMEKFKIKMKILTIVSAVVCSIILFVILGLLVIYFYRSSYFSSFSSRDNSSDDNEEYISTDLSETSSDIEISSDSDSYSCEY
jgi:hypothetical protein